MIFEKLEEIMENSNDAQYKKVKRYPKYKRARKGSHGTSTKQDRIHLFLYSNTNLI